MKRLPMRLRRSRGYLVVRRRKLKMGDDVVVPPGYQVLTDEHGNYLTDGSGNVLIVPI